jgi:hypothetical protein
VSPSTWRSPPSLRASEGVDASRIRILASARGERADPYFVAATLMSALLELASRHVDQIELEPSLAKGRVEIKRLRLVGVSWALHVETHRGTGNPGGVADRARWFLLRATSCPAYRGCERLRFYPALL